VGTEDILKVGGASDDVVDVVAYPLCKPQIYSGKIEKNTTENFSWKVEEEDHDAVVTGGVGGSIVTMR